LDPSKTLKFSLKKFYHILNIPKKIFFAKNCWKQKKKWLKIIYGAINKYRSSKFF